MIIHDRTANKRQSLFLIPTVVLLLALTMVFAGCGGQESVPDGAGAGAVPAVDECGVQVDDTAWQVFKAFTQKHQAGQSITREDFQVFADLPITTPWKESMSGNLPSVRIVNWLDETFHPSEGKDSKTNADRRQFSSSYAYTIEHLADIDPLIKKFQTGGHGCSLKKKVNFWISSDQVPDTLVVAFLPSKPEIRVFHQYLFVDTGVLRAGNFDQLENQLTGILFRARMQLFGDAPAGLEGEAAVANSIRVMMNEGIIGYIEDQPSTIFAPDHPKLGSFNIVPEYVFEYGIKAINLLNTHLKVMLVDEKLMQKNGINLAKTLIASSSLNQGGFSMSATIAANLGDEVLRSTAGSPAAWLIAYQKAAKMNPVPAPDPYQVMDQLHKSMPPFEDSVYEGLLKLLEQTFPTP